MYLKTIYPPLTRAIPLLSLYTSFNLAMTYPFLFLCAPAIRMHTYVNKQRRIKIDPRILI